MAVDLREFGTSLNLNRQANSPAPNSKYPNPMPAILNEQAIYGFMIQKGDCASFMNGESYESLSRIDYKAS